MSLTDWMPPEHRKVIRRHIGRRLREVRLDRGCTRDDLAANLNTQESYIRGIEAGSRECSMWRYMELAALLSTTLTDLLRYVPGEYTHVD